MKRTLSVLLAILLVCFMTACGSKVQDNQSNPAENQEQAESSVSETSHTEASGSEDSIATETPTTPVDTTPQEPAQEETMNESVSKLKIEVDGHSFTATLEENDATAALLELLPLTISMSDYSGFEKVGSLGTSLPTGNAQTTTQAGDVVLYNGNQIVIFYGSNSWSYTRLAHVDDLTGWAEALGNGDVTVTFSAG